MHRKWISPFLYSFKLEEKERDNLNKVILFAMNTDIRKDAEKYKLLDSVENIENYLAETNNNPNARIVKFLKAIKKDPDVLNRNLEDIPISCGLTHYQQIEKKT